MQSKAFKRKIHVVGPSFEDEEVEIEVWEKFTRPWLLNDKFVVPLQNWDHEEYNDFSL